ncbi:hypothetical protein EDC96DRAFT_579499 [Choanephora cucurbitarum]|nr:hypothetical protein EDC96DRAFT_579499 [Choanephora cucurbitarum]
MSQPLLRVSRHRLVYSVPKFMLSMTTCTSVFFVAALVHERKPKRIPWWQNPKYHDTPLHHIQQFYQSWREIKPDLHKLYFDFVSRSPFTRLLRLTDAEKTVISLASLYSAACVVTIIAAPPLLPKRRLPFGLLVGHWFVSVLGLGLLGPKIHDRLGSEQFIALWLSLGLGARACSQLTRHIQPSMPAIFSFGTGSTYGLLTAHAFEIHSNSKYVLGAMLTVDTAGIVLQWQILDHISHVGGAGLGYLYMKYGPNHIWPYMIKTARDLKSKSNRGNGNDGSSDTLMEVPKKIHAKLLGKKTTAPEKQ